MLGAARQLEDPQLPEPFLALPDDQVVAEGFRRVHLDLGAIGQDGRPAGTARIGYRRGDEAEVGRAIIGHDVEPVAVVSDGVLDASPARLDRTEGLLRTIGAGEPHLARRMAREIEHQIVTASGAVDVEEERLVGLEVHQRVFDRIRPQDVAEEPAWPAGFVQHDVEQRARVVGPCRGGRGALDRLGQQLAGGEVLHEDRKRLGAGRIHRVGQEPVIGADLERAHAEVGVIRGEPVLVEQDLLGRLWAIEPPAEDGILRPRLGPGVVQPLVEPNRHREIGLLDPAA